MYKALAYLGIALLFSSAARAASDGDKAFVAKVSQGGMFEVEAGKLASTKAAAQDVRDFAVAEVHDHMLVGQNLKTVSGAEGISFSATLNDEFAGKLQKLSALSGPAFDAAYMSQMAALHDADGAAFAKVAVTGNSDAMRAFGAQTHRIVQRHIGAIHATSPS